MSDAVLLDYQKRWITDKSPVKIIEKSRRIGVTYAEAAESVLWSADPAGGNVYYISFDKEMTQGFIQDCAAWAKAYNAACGNIEKERIVDEDREILNFRIRFTNGQFIQTLSSTPRNLRSKGRPRDRLIIDEAAFIDDLGALLKSAMAMTMWGGTVHIISTHNGEDNPFNELINDVRAGRYDYSLHRVTLDDALNDGLFRRICKVTKQAWSQVNESIWRTKMVNRYRPNEGEELFCIPSMGGGGYLSRALIEANMFAAPLVRYEGSKRFNMAPELIRRAEMDDWINEHVRPLFALFDKKRRHVFGMDFARSGDMTDIAPMEKGETLRCKVPFIIEMHNVPHKQQEQVLFAIVDALPNFTGGAIDAGGNGSYIAEAAVDRYGSMVEAVMFSENWYRENMPRYKAAYEDRQILIPRHDDVLEDHRAIRLQNGVPRVPKGKTDKKGVRHGDSAIAIVLAHYKSSCDPVLMAYQGVARGNAEHDPLRCDHRDDNNSKRFGGGAW